MSRLTTLLDGRHVVKLVLGAALRSLNRFLAQGHEDRFAHVRALCRPLLLGLVLLGVPGCSRDKTMDVLWASNPIDDNGLAKNPVWAGMRRTGQAPAPCGVCPCGSQDPAAWRSARDCTDALVETNSSLECFGHWNWLPVQYEGILTWGGHSNSWYDDDDYYMEAKRADRSLETASRDGLHLEFDSEETVDYWDDTSTWWDDFHHHYVDDNDQAAAGRINGKDAILIGLLGLDSQHDVHSELNPVFAMFVHVNTDPANDQWAFFVKNWGNEGYCGDNEEYLDAVRQNTIKIRIPHPGASAYTLKQNVYVYGDDEDERNQQSWSYQVVPDGALLTFNMRDPSKQVGFTGDLTFTWSDKGTPVVIKGDEKPAGEALLPSSRGSDDGDAKLKARLQRLSPADQRLLTQQLRNLSQHPRPTAKVGTLSTSSVEAPPTKPPGAYPTNENLVHSVKNPAHLARKAKTREFVLSFLQARGIK